MKSNRLKLLTPDFHFHSHSVIFPNTAVAGNVPPRYGFNYFKGSLLYLNYRKHDSSLSLSGIKRRRSFWFCAPVFLKYPPLKLPPLPKHRGCDWRFSLFKCSDWSNLRCVVVKPDRPSYQRSLDCTWFTKCSVIYILTFFFFSYFKTTEVLRGKREGKKSVEAFCTSDLKLFSLLCLWHKNIPSSSLNLFFIC